MKSEINCSSSKNGKETHFVDLGTLRMGNGSVVLSGSAEMACLVGRPLKADAAWPPWWWPPPLQQPPQPPPTPPPLYSSRSSADICMAIICWVSGRTTWRNLSISLCKCRTLASRSSNRCSRRAIYSSFFLDSESRRASSRSRSRNLFITDVLIAPHCTARSRYAIAFQLISMYL